MKSNTNNNYYLFCEDEIYSRLYKIYVEDDLSESGDKYLFYILKLFFTDDELLQKFRISSLLEYTQMESIEHVNYFSSSESLNEFNIASVKEYINMLQKYDLVNKSKIHIFNTIKSFFEKYSEKNSLFQKIIAYLYLISSGKKRYTDQYINTLKTHLVEFFDYLSKLCNNSNEIFDLDYFKFECIVSRFVISFISYDEFYENSIYVKIDDEEFYSYQNANEIVVNKDILKIDSEKLLPIGSTIYFNTGSSYKGRLYVVIDIDKRCGTLFHHLSAIY